MPSGQRRWRAEARRLASPTKPGKVGQAGWPMTQAPRASRPAALAFAPAADSRRNPNLAIPEHNESHPMLVAAGPRVRSSETFERQAMSETLHGSRKSASEEVRLGIDVASWLACSLRRRCPWRLEPAGRIHLGLVARWLACALLSRVAGRDGDGGRPATAKGAARHGGQGSQHTPVAVGQR